VIGSAPLSKAKSAHVPRQRGHLPAGGGLGHAQFRGAAGEAALFGDAAEGPEGGEEVHAPMVHGHAGNATNAQRVAHRQVLDDLIASAIAAHGLAQLRRRLDTHEVGFSPIHDAADLFEDPQFRARQALVSVPDEELGPVRMSSSGSRSWAAFRGPAAWRTSASCCAASTRAGASWSRPRA
jgi:crotonobetainyl-CoA:carnitine CoA-transferase CaiB-like acyl-CoA transferase